MSEFIPFIPENETTEDRFAWDEVLRALHTLSELDDSLDLFETLKDLRYETLEDGLTAAFNYAVMIEVPEGKSGDLEDVMRLLKENGMMEGWGE